MIFTMMRREILGFWKIFGKSSFFMEEFGSDA